MSCKADVNWGFTWCKVLRFPCVGCIFPFIIVHPCPPSPFHLSPIPPSNSVCYFPVTASMWDKFCNSSFQGITASLNQQKLSQETHLGQQGLILPHRGPGPLHPSLLWCFLLELQPCSARKFAKDWICHDLPEVQVMLRNVYVSTETEKALGLWLPKQLVQQWDPSVKCQSGRLHAFSASWQIEFRSFILVQLIGKDET